MIALHPTLRVMVALTPLFVTACGHEHVMLLFPTQSPSAEFYECKTASDAKPEARSANCSKVAKIDPARENQATTRFVDVPACANSEHYYRVAILNADTSSPTVLVHCAQDATLE